MDSNGNIRTGLSSGVEGIFRKREAALSKSHWQVGIASGFFTLEVVNL